MAGSLSIPACFLIPPSSALCILVSAAFFRTCWSAMAGKARHGYRSLCLLASDHRVSNFVFYLFAKRTYRESSGLDCNYTELLADSCAGERCGSWLTKLTLQGQTPQEWFTSTSYYALLQPVIEMQRPESAAVPHIGLRCAGPVSR